VTTPEHTDAPLENAVAAPEKAATSPSKSAWRSRFPLLAVAVFSTLLGAAAATGVFLVAGLPGQPTHRYTVNIFLESEVTPPQKAAIEAAIPAFEPSGQVRFETREEAWRNFQDMAKDRPDVLRETKMEYMPESFNLETEGRLFDCTGYAKVRHMPGVDRLQVVQHLTNDYVATITCDAEYAKP
jgi:cell division transport system permease protein